MSLLNRRSAVTRITAVMIVVNIIVLAVLGGGYYTLLTAPKPATVVTTTVTVTATGPPPSAVKNPNTFIAAFADAPTDLDPAHSHTFYDYPVFLNVLEPLVSFDINDPTKFLPVLAKEFPTVENGGISADGLHYTFRIREGVKFHNGEELTAEDVAYTFRRLATLQFPDSLSWIVLQPLTGFSKDPKLIEKSVEVIDKYTVRFNLLKRDASFLQRLMPNSVAAYILNKKWVMEHGGWDPTSTANWTGRVDEYVRTNVMGTGPYKFVKWLPGERVELVANENYWGGAPKIKNVIFLTVRELSTRLAMLKVGDADYAEIPLAQLDTIKAMEPEGVSSTSGFLLLRVYSISFNHRINMENQPAGTTGIKSNWLTDDHLRRAFVYAMPYEKFNDAAFKGLARRANTYMPKGIRCHDESVAAPKYDPAKAVEEFKLAWGGETWEKGFRFTIWGADPECGIAAQLLKESVESLNPKFKMDVVVAPYAIWLARLQDHSMAMFSGYWSSRYLDPSDMTGVAVYSKGSSATFWGFGNEKIDALADQAAEELDWTKREKLYSEIQRIATDWMPVIWTMQPPALYAHRSWLKGVHFYVTVPGAQYVPRLTKG